ILPAALRQAPEDSIYEWRDDRMAMDLGKRIADQGGAALIVDYGHSESSVGDTLQAVGGHAYADVLAAPGTVDLTAHVDFEALAHAAEAMGANAYGPIALARLIGAGKSGMGMLFKAIAFAHPGLGTPPAF